MAMQLVVRHTFLTIESAASRPRSLTDSVAPRLLEYKLKEDLFRKDCCSDASTADDDERRLWSEEVDSDDECSAPAVQSVPSMPPGVFTAAVSKSVAPKAVEVPAGNNDETRSTLLLRNLPSSFVQSDLLSFLEACGLKGRFDFVYLPMDFATGSNLGYAFVNFVTAAEALAATAVLHGFRSWSNSVCHKVLAVCWSTPLQGLEALIAHFRNSRVMHGSVPDCYRPVLLEKGVRVAFPKATKRLRAPC